MEKINKAILMPLLAGIFLLLKQVFGIEVTTAEQEVYVDAVLALVALIGIFMNFRKE